MFIAFYMGHLNFIWPTCSWLLLAQNVPKLHPWNFYHPQICKGYVFTGVCLSTGGDPYGKERAVRILLECILVV